MPLDTDLQTALGQMTAETKNLFTTLQTKYDALETQYKGLQVQTDAIDRAGQRHFVESGGGKSLADVLTEDDGVQRLLRDRRGKASVQFKGMRDFEQKTTLTSVGVGSAIPGVLMFEREPGIVLPARKKLFLGSLFTRIPTEFNAIDYVKVTQDVTKASPQAETLAKFENALAFVTAVANVRTIATFMRASKQLLQDFKGLAAFIDASLGYAVKLEEEEQLLMGDNSGDNLNGLLPQASAFNTALLVASDGWEYADQIGRTIQQIEVANEIEASFVVLPPAIWWSIRLQKNSQGSYIYGNPATGDGAFNLFGLVPIRSNVISAGTFLVGSSDPTAAVIRDREELIVDISTEDADNFQKNCITIRCEERIALVVNRPASFIKGTFSQSPA